LWIQQAGELTEEEQQAAARHLWQYPSLSQRPLEEAAEANAHVVRRNAEEIEVEQ